MTLYVLITVSNNEKTHNYKNSFAQHLETTDVGLQNLTFLYTDLKQFKSIIKNAIMFVK